MSARATEPASALDERFVVWSPDTTTCMIWTSRARAEQFAQFWRDTRLLGSHGWRVGRVVAELRETEGAPTLAARQGPAAERASPMGRQVLAADPVPLTGRQAAVGSLAPFDTAGLDAAGADEAGVDKAGADKTGSRQPSAGLGPASSGRPPLDVAADAARCRVAGSPGDALATARDELAALLAAKDALIAQLRHQVNDLTLSMVREAAAQGRRIADLERRLAESTRRGGR